MIKYYHLLKDNPTNETIFISLLHVLFTIRVYPCFGSNGYLLYKLMDEIKIQHKEYDKDHERKSSFVAFIKNIRVVIEKKYNNQNSIPFKNILQFITRFDELKKTHEKIKTTHLHLRNDTLLQYYCEVILTMIHFIRFIHKKYNKIVTFLIKCSKDYRYYVTKKEKHMLQKQYNTNVFALLNELIVLDKISYVNEFNSGKVLFYDNNDRPVRKLNKNILEVFLNAAEWNRTLFGMKWLKTHRSLDKIPKFQCGQTFVVNDEQMNITIDESCRVCMVESKNIMYIVVRGTSDRTDVMTDIYLFLHDYDRMIKKHDFTRFIQKHQTKIVQFLEKAEENTVIFTGFSLGGAIMNYFNINKTLNEFLSNFKSQIKIITFNRGESLKTHIYRKETLRPTRSFEQHDIYCTGDYIPVITKNEHVYQYKFKYPSTLEAHSILLIIDRLKQLQHRKNGNVVHDTIEFNTDT